MRHKPTDFPLKALEIPKYRALCKFLYVCFLVLFEGARWPKNDLESLKKLSRDEEGVGNLAYSVYALFSWKTWPVPLHDKSSIFVPLFKMLCTRTIQSSKVNRARKKADGINFEYKKSAC